MDIEKIFTENGGLTFDPYRCVENDPRYTSLFESGMLKDGVEQRIKKLVKLHGWTPWCDAVAIIHANNFAMNTKGNYTAVYYFR